MRRDSELIGRLHYKEGHDLYHWRPGWFMLAGSALHFSPGERDGEEEVLQLKQLQELSKNLFPLPMLCDKFGFGIWCLFDKRRLQTAITQAVLAVAANLLISQ